MGNNLNIELVNGQSGDPAVCVNFTQTGDSILFDAGMLETLSNREILKIKVIAISHTHMDHFIGFDRIIRVNVPHFRSLEVVGPQGIAKNVQGKLAGYTWNLLESDQITYIVHEVNSNLEVQSYKISNNNDFVPTKIESTVAKSNETKSFAKIPLLHGNGEGRYELTATIVDHKMDVLAFCLTLPSTVAVNKAALAASGLKTGPWVAELQQLAKQKSNGANIVIDNVSYPIEKLSAELLESRAGEKILYITDISFTENNINRLKSLSNGKPNLVICEANFQIKDREKATKTAHLTTNQAALISALLGTAELKIFHISNSYANDLMTSVEESEKAFVTYSKMSADELAKAASKELEQ